MSTPSSNTIRVGIIGASGFTGRELIKFLSRHPSVCLDFITSSRYAGQKTSEIFPELGGSSVNLIFKDHPRNISELTHLDAVFISAPDQVALQWVELLFENDIQVIDIGGSFRFEDVSDFEESYQIVHSAPNLLNKASYGLTEAFRSEIASSKLVGNPGCYPTVTLLPLWFLKDFLNEHINLFIIDAKSGVSGAGARKEKATLEFSQISENFYPYKTNKHQHASEIQNQVRKWLGDKACIRFIPHLLPIFRGILSTMYIPLSQDIDIEFMKKEIKSKLIKEPFIRFYDTPDLIQIKKVQQTNFLDFAICYDQDSQVLSVISALDNLVKGAAGQAIQNMNLMFGFNEVASLL